MITCSLRKASGSACGSSLVLTIGRDLVVADETASSRKSARCVIWKPDSVTLPAPVNSCLVIRNGSNSCSMTSNGTKRRTRSFHGSRRNALRNPHVFEHMHCGTWPMRARSLCWASNARSRITSSPAASRQGVHGIAGLGRGIFRMRSDIKIQSRPVFNIRIGRSRGGNDRLEHHHCRLAGVAWHIRTGHTDAVFRFNAENTSERMNLTHVPASSGDEE